MITEIRFPLAPHRFAFLERNRKHNDFAVINVAVLGRRERRRRWSDLRIALGGVNDRAVLAREPPRLLEDTALEDDAIAEAGQLALGCRRPAERRPGHGRVSPPSGPDLRAPCAGASCATTTQHAVCLSASR